MVVSAALTNPHRAGRRHVGTVGFTFNNNTTFTSGDLTAAPNTTSTVVLVDPQNLAGTISDVNILGTLHGSGNINVIAGSAQTNADGGAGFRLARRRRQRLSPGPSPRVTAVKCELQTTVPGPFSPMAPAKS